MHYFANAVAVEIKHRYARESGRFLQGFSPFDRCRTALIHIPGGHRVLIDEHYFGVSVAVYVAH